MSARQKTINCVLPLPQGAHDIKTRATAEAWSKKGQQPTAQRIGGPTPAGMPVAAPPSRQESRHSYKSLPTRFRRDGFKYRQIAREGDASIYEQTWSGCAEPSACYEVIRIRRREGFQIDGRLVEPAEVYPSSAAWGVDGFTFTDKDAAFAKLRELV
jgi:hypothetical protein